MLTRSVSPENVPVLREIVESIINNIVKLYANTILSGHTPEDPSEYFEDVGMSTNDSDFFDWIDNISDYALEPLFGDAIALLTTKNPQDWILIIDRVFNRVHQRSDLSELFIEGGRSALDRLSNA